MSFIKKVGWTGLIFASAWHIPAMNEFFQKVKHRLYKGHHIDYNHNPFYKEGIERISKHKKSDIVIVGDSHVSKGTWPGWTNQGIGNDSTAGVLNRVYLITRVQPALCFIQIGINDIEQEVTEGRIVANIKQICKQLVDAGIVVGLMGIFKVNRQYKNAEMINQKVTAINERLKTTDGVHYIEIAISPMHYLPDHIHLSPQGYQSIIQELQSAITINRSVRE
jgi:hypothetical protein